MRAFGEVLEPLLREHNIAEAARAIGIKRENLSAAKSGKRLLTARQLVDLADHLSVDIAKLIPSIAELGPEKIRAEEARLMWAGRKNAKPRLVDPVLTGPSTTLSPDEERPPGLAQWLEQHWQEVNWKELWMLERWVAQDALEPESEGYWNDAHDFVKKRLAARGRGIS